MINMPRTITVSLIATASLIACDGTSQEASKPTATKTAKVPPPPARPAVDPAGLPGAPVTGDGTELGKDILAWTVTPSTGEMLPVEPTTATMRVNGWSMNGTQYFGGPDGPDELTLPTGDDAAFSGWSTAVSDMKIGETRKVWISAADRDHWPLGGANPQDLVMDIELVSFGIEPAMPNPLPGASIGDAAKNGSSSGLRWYDTATGSGTPLAAGDTATIRCAGWLTDGTPWRTTATVTVTINDSLMPALAEGLTGMAPGSSRKLIVPPDLGAGFNPMGELPAGSTLIVDVDYVGNATSATSASATPAAE
jgi:peptidylprolyl isomerase